MSAPFKLPELPDGQAAEEWADAWELALWRSETQDCISEEHMRQICRRNGATTKQKTSTPTTCPRPVPTFTHSSNQPEAKESLREMHLDAVKLAISSRTTACGDPAGKCRYPFTFTNTIGTSGLTLKRREPVSQWLNTYVYLLLATRMNMTVWSCCCQENGSWHLRKSTQGSAAVIDAADAFEKLCGWALRGYLGARCKVHQFGAGRGEQSKSLPEKVKELCEKHLADGNAYGPDEVPETSGDGGLDLVAWLPFAENPVWVDSKRAPGRGGMLILMAQCKTGTSYTRADARDLNPTSLVEDYLSRPFTTSSTNIPRFFMVAERTSKEKADKFNRAGGVFMDRCRIMECLPESFHHDPDADKLRENTTNWVTAVKTSDQMDKLK